MEVGAALAASRERSELILSHLAAQERDTRLEVGTGLGGELLETAGTPGKLQALADRAPARGVQAVVQSASRRTSPPNCPAMWRRPSLTPSC